MSANIHLAFQRVELCLWPSQVPDYLVGTLPDIPSDVTHLVWDDSFGIRHLFERVILAHRRKVGPESYVQYQGSDWKWISRIEEASHG